MFLRSSVPALAFALALALGLVAPVLPQEQQSAATERPNVVLILADDLGIGDPGCYNPDSKVPTPHLDRLAREGLRLTDAHTPSGVCTPTRYGLLTGRYAWRTRLKRGVLWGRSPCLVDPARETIASLLRRHGYATACVGKWHLGLGSAAETDFAKVLRPGPLDLGFDTFFGIPASLDMPPYLFVRDDAPERPATGTVAGSGLRRAGGGGFWRKGPVAQGFTHESVLPRLAEEAVGWIERTTEERPGRPFFLYFPLTAPHTPWVPTESFRGKSGAGWYGDFAVQVDHTVGRVLAALDRLELADDTLVIFTSDNGAHWTAMDIAKYGHRANGDLRGQKADIWEGGHRVPFLARWPGHVPASAVRDDLLCLTDLLATCAALVGAELADEAGEDSVDQLPVLLGRDLEEPPRTAVVHHSFDGMFAIRQGRWKLVLGRGSGGFTPPARVRPEPGGPTGQLYDLDADPGEITNLFERRPRIVARLSKELETLVVTGRSRPHEDD